MAKKDYSNGNSKKIPPQCGCEKNDPIEKRRFGHTEPRQIDRGIGLTPYQVEQQIERRRLIVSRSRH